jgi:hypothetical protein
VPFEYHWLQRTATLEFELVYLFDYVVIVLLIIAGRTNSAARGVLLGPALLVASSAKAIAIDIINGEWLDLTVDAKAHLSQFSTH